MAKGFYFYNNFKYRMWPVALANEGNTIKDILDILVMEDASFVALEKNHKIYGVLTQEILMEYIWREEYSLEDLCGWVCKDFVEIDASTFPVSEHDDLFGENTRYALIKKADQIVGIIDLKVYGTNGWNELIKIFTPVIQNMDEGMWIIDSNLKLIASNKQAWKVVDLMPHQGLNKGVSNILFRPDILQAFNENGAGKKHTFEYNDKIISLNNVGIYNDNSWVGSMCILVDTTSTIANTEKIGKAIEKESDLRSIIDSSYDGIYVTDKEGLTLLVNKSHERISGIKAESILGRYMKDIIADGLFDITLTDMVVRDKKPVTLTQEVNNGKRLLITGSPIFNREGDVRRVITNVRDVTELINLEKDLKQVRELKARYKNELLLDADADVVCDSAALTQTLAIAEKVAIKDSTVLILGETGVGKEVIAKYIHLRSNRKNNDYLKINCGAIPANLLESELFGYVKGAFTGANQSGKMGIFELADGGTLFLDEIGELPLNLQASLLRVLQDGEITRVGDTKSKKVDVRIIAATNRDLEEMIAKDIFRMDLYYRLNVVSIQVPPLRERVDDIPGLAEFIISKLNKKYKTKKMLTFGFIDYLSKRDWPGNVREMENFIEKQYVINDDDVLDASFIIDSFSQRNKGTNLKIMVNGIPKLKDAIDELERELLTKAMNVGGNTYKAAELLGVSQPTFHRKYKELCEK